MANPNIATEQLLELLLTLKKTTPAAARGILNNQPAIAYALIKLMVSIDVINIEVFQKTLAEFDPTKTTPPSSSTPVPRPASVQTSLPLHSGSIPQNMTMPPTAAPTPISAIPPHLQSSHVYHTTTPPPSYLGSGSIPPSSTLPTATSSSLASSAPTHTPTPPYGYANGQQQQGNASGAAGYGYGQQGYGMYQQQQQYQQQQYQQPQGGSYPGYSGYAAQPAQAAPTAVVPPALPDALASIPEEQKALIMRVLSMTTEQLNLLPPADRATYIQIRTTLGVPTT